MDWILIIIALAAINWIVLPMVLGIPSFFGDLVSSNYVRNNTVY